MGDTRESRLPGLRQERRNDPRPEATLDTVVLPRDRRCVAVLPPSPRDEAGHKKEDARCSGWNVQDEEVCGERDHLRLPHQFRPGGADEHEREECLDAPQQNVEWAALWRHRGWLQQCCLTYEYLRRYGNTAYVSLTPSSPTASARTRISSTPHARRTDRRRSRCPGKSHLLCSSRGPLHLGAVP